MPTRAPKVGEHTDEVLADVLGYDADSGSASLRDRRCAGRDGLVVTRGNRPTGRSRSTGGRSASGARATRRRLLDATAAAAREPRRARPAGRRHRPRGRDVAGDLLPVLPRRRGGGARARRGGRRGPRAGRRAAGAALDGRGRARPARATMVDAFLAYWDDAPRGPPHPQPRRPGGRPAVPRRAQPARCGRSPRASRRQGRRGAGARDAVDDGGRRRSRRRPRWSRCSSAWPRSTPTSSRSARAAPTSSRRPRGSSTRP